MAEQKGSFKELVQKKPLLEIETMIMDYKRNISKEKNLATLHRLTTELNVLQEVREQKQKDSGRLIRKNTSSSSKPELKSFDDYIKSKK